MLYSKNNWAGIKSLFINTMVQTFEFTQTSKRTQCQPHAVLWLFCLLIHNDPITQSRFLLWKLIFYIILFYLIFSTLYIYIFRIQGVNWVKAEIPAQVSEKVTFSQLSSHTINFDMKFQTSTMRSNYCHKALNDLKISNKLGFPI